MLELLILLSIHFVADFLLQSDWMAVNKSKRLDALLLHTGIYSLCFVPFGFKFFAATWVLHTVQDAITSRITSKLWFIELSARPMTGSKYPFYARIANDKRHWFFVAIGADQLLHFWLLAYTYLLFA